jgi:hypothetical protein
MFRFELLDMEALLPPLSQISATLGPVLGDIISITLFSITRSLIVRVSISLFFSFIIWTTSGPVIVVSA